MEYDFRKRPSQSPYTANPPSSYPSVPSSSVAGDPHPHSLYPQIAASAPSPSHAHAHAPPTHGRNHPPFHHPPPPPSNSGLGIRVAIKPDYRITPPPALLPHLGEIPRSNFHFDFDFERNVLIEGVKDNPNWTRLGIEIAPTPPPRAADPPSSHHAHTADPVVSKYISAGLHRDAVPLAVANYGDNPTKVKEFADAYALLREMGFSSNNVAEALLMYDNDTNKALAHFLNGGT